MWLLKASPAMGIASALVLTGCGSVGGSPEASLRMSSAGPGARADAGAGVAAAMVVINEAYAAFNLGNVERWVAMRDPGSRYGSQAQRNTSIQESTQWTKSLMAAGAQFTKIECRSYGEGEWSGIADGGVAVKGHYVTCDTVVSTAPIEGGPATFEWVIANDRVAAVTGWCVGPPGSAQADDVEPARATLWKAARQRVGFTLQNGFPAQ